MIHQQVNSRINIEMLNSNEILERFSPDAISRLARERVKTEKRKLKAWPIRSNCQPIRK